MLFRRKAKPAPVPVPRLEQPGPAQAMERQESGRKILLVDDDPVVRMALSFKLKACGFRVIAASDISQALSAARKENPDLVLADVNFPPEMGGMEWNGFSLAQWIRRVEASRQLPVIVMSGSDRADYAARAADCGASAFLRKPLDKCDLLNTINSALGGTASDPANAPKSSLEQHSQSE